MDDGDLLALIHEMASKNRITKVKGHASEDSFWSG